MAIEPTEVDQRVPSAAAEPASLAGEATLEDEGMMQIYQLTC